MLDADRAGHEVLRTPEVEEAARRRWGDRRVRPRRPDRPRAGWRGSCFAASPEDRREREYLEQLTHPEIATALAARAETLAAGGSPAAVLDAPLLVEAGWDTLCDTLVFVDCPRRCGWRGRRARGWSEEDFAAREGAQESLDLKRQPADVVVDNSGLPGADPGPGRASLARPGRLIPSRFPPPRGRRVR